MKTGNRKFETLRTAETGNALAGTKKVLRLVCRNNTYYGNAVYTVAVNNNIQGNFAGMGEALELWTRLLKPFNNGELR